MIKKMNPRFLIKCILVIAGILFLNINNSSAQKFAYVNTEYILENIPDYKTAQQTLDNLSITWQKEIEDKYAIIDKLYKAYQAEQVLLTEEMKRRRQDEISQKEKDVKDLQKQRFGYEGDLFKKKQAQSTYDGVMVRMRGFLRLAARANGLASIFFCMVSGLNSTSGSFTQSAGSKSTLTINLFLPSSKISLKQRQLSPKTNKQRLNSSQIRLNS